jgi:release factor glutamine methyltransferase
MVPKTQAVKGLAREIGWVIEEKYPELFKRKAWKPMFRRLARDIERLKSGEPVGYVIGTTPFLGEKVLSDKRALIPRTETEYWVGKVIDEYKNRKGKLKILDLCAGGGAVGLSMLKKIPGALVVFGEVDPRAIALIRANMEFHRIPKRRYKIIRSDLFSRIPGTFDLILTNPPYIPASRRKKLPRSVTAFEPSLALFGGADGMHLVRKILSAAPEHLSPRGVMYMEFDSPQAPKIKRIAGERGEVFRDQFKRLRYLRFQAGE